MATITRNISTKVNTSGETEILLRLTVSRSLRLLLKSGTYMNPKRFKDGAVIMPGANHKETKALNEIEKRLTTLEQLNVSLNDPNPKERIPSAAHSSDSVLSITGASREGIRKTILLRNSKVSALKNMDDHIIYRLPRWRRLPILTSRKIRLWQSSVTLTRK